jgi:hypothetical protein
MSDLTTMNFRSLLIKRKESTEWLKVRGYIEKIHTLFMLLRTTQAAIETRAQIDEMLSILHASAVKNGDLEALGKCEIISKQLCTEWK